MTKSELEQIRELREKFAEIHEAVRDLDRQIPVEDRRRLSQLLTRFSEDDWDRHERMLKKVELIEAGGVFLKHTTGIAVMIGGAYLMFKEIFH